jgi:twitching motility protein PilT
VNLDSSIPDDEFSFRDVAKDLGALERPAPSPREGAVRLPIAPPRPQAQAAPAAAPPRIVRAPEPAAPEPEAPEPEAPAPEVEELSGSESPLSGIPADDPLLRRFAEGAPTSPRHMVEGWLAIMIRTSASDLILRAGGRPSCRVDGKVGFLPGRVPNPGALLEVLDQLLGEERMRSWREKGSADCALMLDGLGRFRLNAYKQMGEPAVVIRRVRDVAPDLDALDLPSDSLKNLALRKRGLILVTGIAGSGKSTTLAAMIQHMNLNVERHVVTLEDPVELLFKEERCVISQREVGTDCGSFYDGLRHALRQSPDVILIGEMRDAETVNSALDATETGHLVMSTLHTVNAPQTVDRILSFFPAERHAQVRQRLADNLAGVLSQRLVVRVGGKGLVPAFELLLSTPHIRELLAEGKTTEMSKVIELGTERGLVSFNQCLRRLVKEGKVELNDALAASDRPEELVLSLRGITASSARTESKAKAPRPGAESLRMSGRPPGSAGPSGASAPRS